MSEEETAPAPVTAEPKKEEEKPIIPEVTEVASKDYIQVNLTVGKHGGRTVRQGVVISREVAEKNKGKLKELVTKQLSKQLESAVDEIISFED